MEKISLILFAVRLIIFMSCFIDYDRENGDRSMEYLSIRQTADKWEISKRRIQVLCAENRIHEAIKIDSLWAIPTDAVKPKDERVKSGKYMKNI
jgi:hypothetical protein